MRWRIYCEKIIAILVTVMLMAGCLSACSKDGEKNTVTSAKETSVQSKNTINIVTTIFPEYDWVKNIVGNNNAEITMLLDNGVDLHSYQPTAADITKIYNCDMFIYVGGESDEWVEDVLKESTNKNMAVINLLEVLGDKVKPEEIVEGMEHEYEHDEDEEEEDDHDHEHEHDEDEDHDHEEDHDHDHEEELDEHIWLSLRNTKILVNGISEALQKVDQEHAEDYKQNAENYVKKLDELDEKYKEAVAAGSAKTLLFGDRFPFRYLTDDYGLEYFAAFSGCSAESEASFETITFLSKKVDELSLHSVMTIEGKDHRIAETIVQNTKTKDQQIVTLDSMQSTTSKDVENGVTYLSVMENNLSALKEALK